jgi:hypothetical protein
LPSGGPLVDDDEQVGEVNLEIPRQLADRLTAQVRTSAASPTCVVRPAVTGQRQRHQRFGGRRLEAQRRAPARLVDDIEADVVPCPYAAARIARPTTAQGPLLFLVLFCRPRRTLALVLLAFFGFGLGRRGGGDRTQSATPHFSTSA